MTTQQLKDDHKKIIDILKKKANWPTRHSQMELCGKLLTHARDVLLKDEWGDKKLSTSKKTVLKDLIRKSSESADFRKTVDFVTPNALNLMRVNSQNEISFEEGLSHEHMMPCEAVFKKILQTPNIDIFEFLKTTGFRALVSRVDASPSENDKLDANGMKSNLPKNISHDYPEDFYVFARYEAAGVFSNLIPVNDRGVERMKKYLENRTKYNH